MFEVRSGAVGKPHLPLVRFGYHVRPHYTHAAPTGLKRVGGTFFYKYAVPTVGSFSFKKLWVSRLFSGTGAVRKPHLPVLVSQKRIKNGKLNSPIPTGLKNSIVHLDIHRLKKG